MKLDEFKNIRGHIFHVFRLFAMVKQSYLKNCKNKWN